MLQIPIALMFRFKTSPMFLSLSIATKPTTASLCCLMRPQRRRLCQTPLGLVIVAVVGSVAVALIVAVVILTWLVLRYRTHQTQVSAIDKLPYRYRVGDGAETEERLHCDTRLARPRC